MLKDTIQQTEESWDREAAYDEHIAPLMAKIIALCKEASAANGGRVSVRKPRRRRPGYVHDGPAL
jgi:hypothetical protein